MIHLRPKFYFILVAGLALLVGCGDDPIEEVTPPAGSGTTVPKGTGPTDGAKPPPKPPVVYVEELDQFQGYYKEQHDTSFSHVRKKNWTSFTAGKEGVLTRIALYGKPHFATSDFYGPEMSGIIREGNPDSGPKLADWTLSRAEVVAQLAEQGLSELAPGWIDVKMLGEAALEVGKTYYMVCERITGGKHWFGAFAFSEGDSYKEGRHWLHPEHDLVFRTYVGQVEDPDAPPSPEENATGTPSTPSPETNPNKVPHHGGAPIPQKPVIAPAPTPVPTPQNPPTPPAPPQNPPTPPQPRLRSLPLPQDPPPPGPGEALLPPGDPPQAFPPPVDPPQPDPVPANPPQAVPSPPPVPKAEEDKTTSDKNETKPKRLLPGFFRRRP